MFGKDLCRGFAGFVQSLGDTDTQAGFLQKWRYGLRDFAVRVDRQAEQYDIRSWHTLFQGNVSVTGTRKFFPNRNFMVILKQVCHRLSHFAMTQNEHVNGCCHKSSLLSWMRRQ